MKIDMNLIRELLLKKESDQDYLHIEDYNEFLIYEHIYTLKKAGFIEAQIISDISGVISFAYIIRITWEGYEFINAIRDKNLFDKALEKLKPLGNFTLNIFKAICIELVKD